LAQASFLARISGLDWRSPDLVFLQVSSTSLWAWDKAQGGLLRDQVPHQEIAPFKLNNAVNALLEKTNIYIFRCATVDDNHRFECKLDAIES
jgi:hypothetical protein